MDALETFIQAYSEAAAKPADPNDPLDVTQRTDAVAMDRVVVDAIGSGPGKTNTAIAAEKETGRKPNEPEDADVEKNFTSEGDDADVDTAGEDFGEQASHQEHAESDGETAAVRSVFEEDSEVADPSRTIEVDEEAAVKEPVRESDADIAVLESIEESDTETAEAKVSNEEFGGVAAIETIFSEDSQVETRVERSESTAMIEVMPIGLKEEFGHVMDNSINHQGELKFSVDESDTPMPDFAVLSESLSSMDETDMSLSSLPFTATFSGRTRDQ